MTGIHTKWLENKLHVLLQTSEQIISTLLSLNRTKSTKFIISQTKVIQINVSQEYLDMSNVIKITVSLIDSHYMPMKQRSTQGWKQQKCSKKAKVSLSAVKMVHIFFGWQNVVFIDYFKKDKIINEEY